MYLPWLFAACFESLIIVSRLTTNRRFLSGRGLPTWVSVMNVFGFIGLVVTLFWSIFSIGWWGPIPIVLVYLVSNFVPSVVTEAVKYPSVRVLAAMHQAADELKDVPQGPEKVQMVQRRAAEILGVETQETNT